MWDDPLPPARAGEGGRATSAARSEVADTPNNFFLVVRHGGSTHTRWEAPLHACGEL